MHPVCIPYASIRKHCIEFTHIIIRIIYSAEKLPDGFEPSYLDYRSRVLPIGRWKQTHTDICPHGEILFAFTLARVFAATHRWAEVVFIPRNVLSWELCSLRLVRKRVSSARLSILKEWLFLNNRKHYPLSEPSKGFEPLTP